MEGFNSQIIFRFESEFLIIFNDVQKMSANQLETGENYNWNWKSYKLFLF